MEKVEFHNTPDGRVMYRTNGEEERRLTKFSVEINEYLAHIIQKRYTKAYTALSEMYNGDKYKMVERFVRCNFGANDLLTNDIEDGILYFEEVQCPLRGICKHENVICKPKNHIGLTISERDITRLYLSGYTLDEISQQLHKNRRTTKSLLTRVKNKLGAKTSREIIKLCRLNGIAL